jgi:hypothetical protein
MRTCSVRHCVATTGLQPYGSTLSYYCPHHYQVCRRLETERRRAPFLCADCLGPRSQCALDTVFLEVGESRCSACQEQTTLFFYHLSSDNPDSDVRATEDLGRRGDGIGRAGGQGVETGRTSWGVQGTIHHERWRRGLCEASAQLIRGLIFIRKTIVRFVP